MGKKKRKKSCKNYTLEKIVLATAFIQLISTIIDLIEKLLE